MRKENRGETLRIEEGEVWERWEVRAARAGMGAVWEIAPEPPKGDKLEKRLLFVLTGINDELRIYEIIFKQKIDCE